MPATGGLVVLAWSPRVAPGLLSWPAWSALRAADSVLTATDEHPLAPYLAEAGVAVDVLPPALDGERAAELIRRAAAGERVVWLPGPDGDGPLVRTLETRAEDGPQVEVLDGSHDLPGARMLDVVAVMDRLRSPGGCPWDAEQTHASLAPYLLEEAYEAYDALDDGDLVGLREELGDVLLQVAFHARIAHEAVEGGWSIDDVAGDLVDKLVRRHPHVFADVTVTGAAEVNANWETIKTAEKGRRSIVEGVPLSQPALSLAATLHRRATRAGLAVSLPETDAALAALRDRPDAGTLAELLLALVGLSHELGLDPEAALRTRARSLADQLAAASPA